MFWLKLLIIAIVITAFLVAAMSLKLFFDKDATPPGGSCHSAEEDQDDGACSLCSLRNIAKCDEKTMARETI